MSKKEIYISIDVETNGPIPGINSMLSLGAAAFIEGEEFPVSTYSVNLQTLVDSKPDPATMDWWTSQPKEIWEACRKDPKSCKYAMAEFSNWVEAIAGLHNAKPVAVAYPSGFDFMFVYWYLIRFTDRSPFSFSCIDIKSVAFSLLGKDFRECNKRNWKKEWLSDHPHTHVAVDDAIEQGHSFMQMLKEIKAHNSNIKGYVWSNFGK